MDRKLYRNQELRPKFMIVGEAWDRLYLENIKPLLILKREGFDFCVRSTPPLVNNKRTKTSNKNARVILCVIAVCLSKDI